MANYRTGEETKNRILEKSKELFYRNGLKNTTYNQISKKANVNIGTIVYHFRTIDNIGHIIYSEILKNRYATISQKMAEAYPDKEINDALNVLAEYRINTDSYIRYPNYTRFVGEITAIMDTWELPYFSERIEKLFRYYNFEHTEKDVFMQKLLYLPFANLVVNESKHIHLDLSAKEISDYHIKAQLLSMHVSKKEIEEMIQQVDEIASNVQLTISSKFEIS